MIDDPADRPRSALLSHLAFAIVLAIVIARCLMLEAIRDVGGDPNAPPGPGAATSIVLDWLSFVPVLLLMGRRLIDAGFRLRFNLAHTLLAALALWTLASIFWADDCFLALISAARIAGGAALFWATSQIATRSAHIRVVVGVLVGILLVNVVQGALYQNVELADLRQYFEQNKDQILAQHGWRAGDYSAQRFEMKLLAGEMLNFSISANVLGALIVAAALAAYGAARQRIVDRDDMGFAGALLIAALGSVYVLGHTGSKASWAALVLGIVLLELWWRTRGWLGRHRSLAFGACIALVAIGVAGVIGLGITRGSLPSDSLNFRWRYWVGSWPLVRAHPLRGVGWGNFADAYLQHRVPAAAEEIQDPHSFPVRWLVELGVIGLALGVGWLVTWGWRATRANANPLTPTAVRSDSSAVPNTHRPREDRSTLDPSAQHSAWVFAPMRISLVLCALLLALALTIACTIDFAGDGSYATLELMRRSMFIGLIALAVGLVCLGRRAAPGAPFYVDERPARCLMAGLFVGVLMLLLESAIDMTLFQPGPWALTLLAMGALLGQSDAAPPRTRSLRSSVLPAAVVIAFAWIAAGYVAGRVIIAEWHASVGARLLRPQSANAKMQYLAAAGASPVSNFDYIAHAAEAAMRAGDPSAARPLLGRAIEASPQHAMSWLTRSRYLASQPNVSAEDAQQAVADFGQAIALNPNDVDLRLEYADLLERFGHRLEAAEQLETALKLDDELDPAEPERLEQRSPGKATEIRARAEKLRETVGSH